MQQPGLLAAHLTRGVGVLAACYACAETLTQLYPKKSVSIEQKRRKEGRKERNNFRQEERKEGGREGGKEGRTAGRQEGRGKGLAPECCVRLPICTCYFQTAAASPAQFTSVGFKMGQALCNAVYRFQPQHAANTMPSCAMHK